MLGGASIMSRSGLVLQGPQCMRTNQRTTSLSLITACIVIRVFSHTRPNMLAEGAIYHSLGQAIPVDAVIPLWQGRIHHVSIVKMHHRLSPNQPINPSCFGLNALHQLLPLAFSYRLVPFTSHLRPFSFPLRRTPRF